MTEISDTPAQQLARIKHLEDHIAEMPPNFQAEILRLCAITRKALEAQPKTQKE